MAEAPTFTVEDATIKWRNFEGRQTQYNEKGNREFTLVLPEDFAKTLLADGWNVREREPREEGGEVTWTLQVKVSFLNYPPTVTLLTSNSRTLLSESQVESLDWLEPANIDMVIRGNVYDFNGKHGIKAYLKNMFFTAKEDELDMKYADFQPQAED